MTHWNYRVLRRIHADEITYAVYTVYYRDGKPIGHSMTPAAPLGETPAELQQDIEMQWLALTKPHLEYDTMDVIL